MAALAIRGENFCNSEFKLNSILRTKLFIFMLLAVMTISCQDPPTSSLDRAKSALKMAADAGALKYAEDQYRAAEAMIKSGWMEMAHQNGRLALFRNYHKADSLLLLATKTAIDAKFQTIKNINNLDSLSRSERDAFRKELTTWRDNLDGALENFQAERHWSAAEMALKTSEGLIAKGEYDAARDSIKKGKEALQRLEGTISEYANDEAQKISVWRQWVRQTLAESRANGTYAVIVDKSAHKAYLIKGGELVRSYRCELGYNSARQKLFAGDGATPEGTYYVTKAKYTSKFHKALLINYPNQTDLRRLKENKAKGIISRYARAGALIEIHGEGGRNRDWTDGCVALNNKDMEHLMQYATVGTPVTIVRRSDIWP
jgi:L,D-peptidoglycan transpeptidase YkuD (ErfK/YbiS/YcfS/YnhG family)